VNRCILDYVSLLMDCFTICWLASPAAAPWRQLSGLAVKWSKYLTRTEPTIATAYIGRCVGYGLMFWRIWIRNSMKDCLHNRTCGRWQWAALAGALCAAELNNRPVCKVNSTWFEINISWTG